MSRSGEIRARAREAAEEVQRQAIAETTCEVIAAEGVEGASLRRIAEALGSTTGLISHYFANKDELLVRALEYAYQQLAGDSAAGGAPTLDSLLDGFCATLAPTDTARQFWLVLVAFRSATIGNPTLADAYQRFSSDAETAVRAVVADELSRPAGDPASIDAANAVSVILEGFGGAIAVDPELFAPDAVRDLVRNAIDGVLDAARRG